MQVSGRLGPWKSNDTGETGITASYTFRQARLGLFHGIAGTLSSQGKFNGVLGRITVQGTTETSDFEVTHTHHTVHLKTQFNAVVSGKNGDTFLQPVRAQLENTHASVEGKVVRTREQKGKTALLTFVGKGRVQDLFWLFGRSVPPIRGAITFHARVRLPPGRRRFLEKLRLEGDFDIEDATLANATRQNQVDQLSSRAQDSKRPVSTSVGLALRGHVLVQEGIATFSTFSIRVPGASALLKGNYGLLDERVNLRGTLQMDASPSRATSGVKSAVLKILTPFINKSRHHGSVLPVSITGTYSQPSFGLALASNR